MNIVESYKQAVERKYAIEEYLKNNNKTDEEKKVGSLLMSAFGVDDSKLEAELEGLELTIAWLTDVIGVYADEKGYSLDKTMEMMEEEGR